jgi:hypothetical protein
MSPLPTLPEFQQYLLSRKLVPEKNAAYYAYWVSRYLAFSNRLENMDKEEMLQRFLDDLQSRQHMEDWQVQQAREAVQLYTNHFLGGNTSDRKTAGGNISSNTFEPEGVMAKMREAISIKHYSYSTERTYPPYRTVLHRTPVLEEPSIRPESPESRLSEGIPGRGATVCILHGHPLFSRTTPAEMEGVPLCQLLGSQGQ